MEIYPSYINIHFKPIMMKTNNVRYQINTIKDDKLRRILKGNRDYENIQGYPASKMETAILGLDWSCNHPAIQQEGIEPFDFYGHLRDLARNEHITFPLLTFKQVIDSKKTGIYWFKDKPKETHNLKRRLLL